LTHFTTGSMAHAHVRLPVGEVKKRKKEKSHKQ